MFFVTMCAVVHFLFRATPQRSCAPPKTASTPKDPAPPPTCVRTGSCATHGLRATLRKPAPARSGSRGSQVNKDPYLALPDTGY